MAESVDPRQAAVSAQVPSPVAPKDNGPNATGATWGPIPQMTAGMTFAEIGQTGLRQFSGFTREEFLQQLIGRQGAQKYREMRDNSPIIGAILFAIESTMKKVEWRVMPPDDGPESQEMVDFVESLKNDMTETWNDTITEDLSMLPFGFAFKEIVYKKRLGRDPGPDPQRPGHDLARSEYDDGKIGWKRLTLRYQDTILKWFFDENGQVKGVTQQPWVGPLVDIPIEKGLLFRAKPFKNNPEGISILRQSYVPYYYMKRMQEQEAIWAERMSGVPVLTIPGALMEAARSGASDATAALAAFQKIVTNVRMDGQMGIILPSDTYGGNNGPSNVPQYSFKLVTPEGRGGFDWGKSIERYSTQIMTSVLADFLVLGHTARGTQSLADNKVDMFFQAIEGYLNANAAVYNRHALPRLWKLNGFDQDNMPHFEPDLAVRVDLDALSNFILRLSQAGMPLFPNEDLQSYVLDAAGLPDVIEDDALRAAGLAEHQLDNVDEKDATLLDNLQNPPEPAKGAPPGKGGKSNGAIEKLLGKPPTRLEKMLIASIARRQVRHAGPKFGVSTTQKRKANGHLHGRQ